MITPELRTFIDRVIVPALVDRFLAEQAQRPQYLSLLSEDAVDDPSWSEPDWSAGGWVNE